MKQTKSTIRIAGFLGGTAVIVLALAAHALEKILPEKSLQSIITAGEIQLFHAIALVALSGLMNADAIKLKRISAYMLVGVCMFSCSIYLLIFSEMLGMLWLKTLWPVTPIGGILLIISWFMIAALGFQKETSADK